MSVSAPETEPIKRLATYLRENPLALGLPPEEIAAACNAPIELVRSALEGPKTAQKEHRQRGEGWLKPAWKRLVAWVDRNEKKTPWIVLVTLLIALGVNTLVPKSFSGLPDWAPEAVKGVAVALAVLIQFGVFYRHGKCRHPLAGAVVAWVIATISALISAKAKLGSEEGGILFIVMPFAMLAMSVFYALTGSAAAVIGGYRRIRREEQDLARLDRQQLLERLFAIEGALSAGTVAPHRGWENNSIIIATTTRLSWLAPLIGFVTGLAAGLAQGIGNTLPRGDSVIAALVAFAISIVSGICHIGMSFLAGNLRRSISISLLYAAGSLASALPIWLISLAARNPKIFEDVDPVDGKFGNWIASLVFALFVGVFAGMGAHLEARSRRNRKLKGNDPETLLNELVTVQQLLNPTAGVKAVLVVDAAKSAMMKANADPLTAEWSFRAYQQFIDKIVREFHGHVHATAGDGAVAIFDSSHDAFVAAQMIQTKIADFNQNVNKLETPFRLRIGIHSDRIGGDLNKVQFSAVIDIAAHVEAVAPIGGIAVTERVMSVLEGHRFASLPDLVDGQTVLIAVQPTVEL